MKKQLLVGAFMLASFLTAQAQEVIFDFNDLTVGNVGTVIDGSAPGQDDWFTLAQVAQQTTTTNNANEVFQIVAGGKDGKGFQLTGPNGTGGQNLMAKVGENGAGAWWTARTAGNNILQVRYDFYTGTASSSLNEFQVHALGGASNAAKTLAGIFVNMNTLEVRGLAHFTDTPGTGTYNFGLGAEADDFVLTLPENTWVVLGFDYNYTTGGVKFIAPGAPDTEIPGAAAENNILEIDFVANDGSILNAEQTAIEVPNTAAAVAIFDNLTFKAVGTAGVNENLISKLSVFPNPANDVVTIANNENILVNGVEVVDLNGRTVKTAKFDGVANAQINVSDLASGVYMMTISSDKGSVTKKMVKN